MEEERQIKTIKSYDNRKDWANEIPRLVYKLKHDYNFYYDGLCILINRPLADIINKNGYKHHHKILLYFNLEEDVYYLAIYKKYSIDIYTLENYSNAKHYLNRYKTAQTWMRKIKELYDKAAQEKEDELLCSTTTSEKNQLA